MRWSRESVSQLRGVDGARRSFRLENALVSSPDMLYREIAPRRFMPIDVGHCDILGDSVAGDVEGSGPEATAEDQAPRGTFARRCWAAHCLGTATECRP